MIQNNYTKPCNNKEGSGCYIPSRQMHTIQPVNSADEKNECSRKTWFQQFIPNEGMYMFGGQDRQGKKKNDLWLIIPY